MLICKVAVASEQHRGQRGATQKSELFCLSLHTASPRFTRTPEDQTGVQGGVASFVCQAAGDPQPKIVWNKKGKKVSNQRFEVRRRCPEEARLHVSSLEKKISEIQ